MDLLQYTFFQHALLGSLLASISCALVGTYIVARRMVFISGGLSHASFGGLGLGLFFGLPPVLTAAAFAVLSAFGIEWLNRGKDVREDSAIAVLWTFGMAIGIIFSFLTPGFTSDLSTFLFGNILTITTGDLIMLAAITGMVAVFYALFIDTIVYTSFDREFALSRKLPVRAMEYAMMAFTALTIVACLRMVGIVLAISMLTIPQITANIFVHRFKSIILLSAVIGYASCLGGLAMSYFYNIPSGATIIFLSILIFAVCRLAKGISVNLQRKRKG